jgi:predicted CXXCH cytochrome family protein
MAGYDIPTDQEHDYRRSVHGELLLQKRDLSAPTCVTCHDNHGASPPGLTSIAEICGQCHVTNSALFVASPHKPAFDRLGLTECASCHGNHEILRTSDAMLGVDGDALCVACHDAGSAGFAAAKDMRHTIDRLKDDIALAAAALAQAERMGMEVSGARYDFHGTDAALIKARTAVHRFSAPHLLEVAQPGFELSRRTERVASAAIAEALTRRANLLLPLALIGLVMVLLWLKLRRLEQPSDEAE